MVKLPYIFKISLLLKTPLIISGDFRNPEPGAQAMEQRTSNPRQHISVPELPTEDARKIASFKNVLSNPGTAQFVKVHYAYRKYIDLLSWYCAF